MSFSSNVKDELAEAFSNARHCQIAEIAAMLSMDGQIVGVEKGHPVVVLHTENLAVAKKYFTLLKKTFNISAKVSVRRSAFLQKNGIYTIVVTNQEDTRRILDATRMTPLEEPGQWIPSGVILQKDCCRRNFLRGAYLASGSMSNPEKGYHFFCIATMRIPTDITQGIIVFFVYADDDIGIPVFHVVGHTDDIMQ